jgi:hypothetical protein
MLLVGLLCAPGLGLGAAIKGKVVFVGSVPPPKKVDITIDQYVCGTAKDAGDLLLSPQKELRNAVVWLEGEPATQRGLAGPSGKGAWIDGSRCVQPRAS